MDDEVKLNPHEQIGSFELLHELLDQFRFFICREQGAPGHRFSIH
jgi:hypothetical protein